MGNVWCALVLDRVSGCHELARSCNCLRFRPSVRAHSTAINLMSGLIYVRSLFHVTAFLLPVSRLLAVAGFIHGCSGGSGDVVCLSGGK